MKEYDQVTVINDSEAYKKEGVFKGMIGTIMDPRKINGKWLVIFSGEIYEKDGVWCANDIECEIKEEDMEVIVSA